MPQGLDGDDDYLVGLKIQTHKRGYARCTVKYEIHVRVKGVDSGNALYLPEHSALLSLIAVLTMIETTQIRHEQ